MRHTATIATADSPRRAGDCGKHYLASPAAHGYVAFSWRLRGRSADTVGDPAVQHVHRVAAVGGEMSPPPTAESLALMSPLPPGRRDFLDLRPKQSLWA